MLSDIQETQAKKVTKTRRHRSISKQHKPSRSPSSRASEISQKKRSSSRKKRTELVTLTKDEMKHQRFVNDLKKDIQVYINQRLRESRFDPRGNQCLQMNPLPKTKRTTSNLGSHRRNKTDTIAIRSGMNNRRHSMEFLTRDEIERFTADVQAILRRPILKNYYTQFIQVQQRQPSARIHLRLLEESIL